MTSIKTILGSMWKSLPTEILILIGFLITLSQLDFLPDIILQILTSTVAIISFSMLFFRMFNSIAHEYTVKKAVRLAEKTYISNNYIKVRQEYISIAQQQAKTVLEVMKNGTSALKNPKENNISKVIYP